jgi:hypothetical protein
MKNKITQEQVIAREKMLLEADPIGLIKGGYLRIRDKKTEDIIPFVLNTTQNRIVDLIQKKRLQDLPVFLFVLKARQMGVSTLAQAITFAFTSQRQNVTALDVADDMDGASYIFKMNELFYDRMSVDHPHLTPARLRSDERRLEFAKTYSRIMIDTANNATAGRKFTLQILHLSEVAFYKNFKTLRKALMPAVSKNPDTIVIFETTANGINAVSKFWAKIKLAYEKDPKNATWIPVFCAWNEHEEYQLEFSSDELKRKFMVSMTPKERKIQTLHQLTLEQLHWRRRTIQDDFDDDDEAFEVEFPLTDKEAFKSTAKRVFSEKMTAPQEKFLEAPKIVGELELVDRRPVFVPDEQGFLKIFQAPQPEEQYVMPMDTCESALTHDEACAHIIKRSTWTQVAHLHGHMDPEDFAQRCVALGLYYNRALACPESTGIGLTTVTALARMHYPNICHHKVMREVGENDWVEKEELGFSTNVKTKPLVISKLQDALRTMLLVIKDRQTLDQIETYVIKNAINSEGEVESDTRDGKVYLRYGAEEGFRDDCVLCLAIGVYYGQQIPTRTFTPGIMRQSNSHSITGY